MVSSPVTMQRTTLRLTAVSEDTQLHKADALTNRARRREDAFTARSILRARRERHQRHRRHSLNVLNKHPMQNMMSAPKVIQPRKLLSTRVRTR